MDNLNAIISTTDKSGLDKLVELLINNNYNIYSTSGTYKYIKKYINDNYFNKLSNLKLIEDLTQFPEILNGRVKTLHPLVYGGILTTCNDNDNNDCIKYNIPKFSLIVCNLYNFNKALDDNLSLDECIENIDIGGVSLIRAGCKNSKFVTTLSSPEQYDIYIKNYYNNQYGGTTFIQRIDLASKGYKLTSEYDNLISKYLNNTFNRLV